MRHNRFGYKNWKAIMNCNVLVVSLTAALLVVAGCTRRQRTISVDLPVTDSPASMPDADNRDSLVVTITREKQALLSNDATTLDVLAQKVKDRVATGAQLKAYVRADASAPFGVIMVVADDLRAAGIAELGLLVRPRNPERILGNSKGKTPLMGLLVTAADRPAQGQRTIVVRAFKGFGQFAGLKINEEDATRDNLESRLSEIFKNRAEKVMFLRADEELPFGDVAQVIDIGLSSGARVIVLTAKAGPSSDQGAGANVAGEPAGGVLGSVIGRPQIAVPKVAPPQRVRVSQGVMQALLQSRVEPDYPPLARQAHIQGTVVLRATIGKDGTVQNLLTVSGHPMLIPAAVRAVRQWRYKPYYLNGEPVKVETQIPVAF